jgi:hypothetical protein
MWTPHAKPKEKYIQTLELSVKIGKNIRSILYHKQNIVAELPCRSIISLRQQWQGM